MTRQLTAVERANTFEGLRTAAVGYGEWAVQGMRDGDERVAVIAARLAFQLYRQAFPGACTNEEGEPHPQGWLANLEVW